MTQLPYRPGDPRAALLAQILKGSIGKLKGTPNTTKWKQWQKLLLSSLQASQGGGPNLAQQYLVSMPRWARKIQGGMPQAMPRGVGGFVRPLGTKMPGGSEYGVSDAEGAPSASGGRYHAAKDWFAPGGSHVYSPLNGRVVEVKTSKNRSGQVYGGVVKIQDAQGRVWVFRHVNPTAVKVGQQVRAGTPIAKVTPWAGGSSHAHIELWKSLAGGYNFENMLDPAKVMQALLQQRRKRR